MAPTIRLEWIPLHEQRRLVGISMIGCFAMDFCISLLLLFFVMSFVPLGCAGVPNGQDGGDGQADADGQNGDECKPCGQSCCARLQYCIDEECCGWSKTKDAPYDIDSIWGTSETNIYAVGIDYGAGWSRYGSILHYDGSDWTEMKKIEDMDILVMDIWGASNTDIFVVGSSDPPGSGLIMHYNGEAWTEMIRYDTISLVGVRGITGSDVYAVGLMDGVGVVMHYDGSAWTASKQASNLRISDIWPNSESSIFAVGEDFHSNIGVILQYDGNSWKEMKRIADSSFYGVWGSSNEDIYVVGTSIMHYNGNYWSTSVPSRFSFDVWGTSANNVFAVSGNQVLHFDGTGWLEMNNGTDAILTSIWGVSERNVFVAGGNTLLIFKCQEN